MRNLDVTTLRSFVAVADHGGVTRAAGMLNLTQSAVSMQLKRLEELLGVDLLDRANRKIALTASGDQFLSYARRMVALNDEVVSRLTDRVYEGEIRFGVPHDIVYPLIPRVLQEFHARFPRMKVRLAASWTYDLLEEFGRGESDVILTTETGVRPGGETLVQKPLRWMGAPGGVAWRQRPLRLAFERHCAFRPQAIEALDAAGIEWEIGVETESDRAIEVTVSADLAVNAMIEGTEPAHLVPIDHGGALPELETHRINLYQRSVGQNEAMDVLGDLVRQSFSQW
ncbi:LysR family transcriptional regulator [Rhodalgimonas zhirmunskyi]|uniref:LysR family transcriptional regulator n=1 Tax=Rhodalgimonas zhirmunskyi TaxID=2964767 RepID=A0AAJ1X576_9RHOB|nr:LysR family transcriptional regulator [Rhodoalgimonas zhirmunskyi]MDQ2094988.1 LysR family transcriptional regulator [Rhodoalgimonas zhirmunskyi]